MVRKIREALSEDVLGIVDLEWGMFDKVQNIGGRADCQDNRPAFYIMRGSQLSAWSREMLESYLQDLREAQAQDRNLLAEKYGYMMEQTNPVEYVQIKDRLPARSEEKLSLIKTLCRQQVRWQEELSEKFPALTGRGRATHSDEDKVWETSFETYLAGELSTYSMRTLHLYMKHMQKQKEDGINMNRRILEKEVELYGYPSLEAAEKRHR